MNKLLATLAVLATAGTALAQVDPARPMVTGRGNVDARPGKVIVTNQTKTEAKETLKLERFEVTGSLIKKPAPAPKSAEPKR
ncbi:MAG: hypothetical protein HZA93_27200 [Verrucomicrobia bacterium]|nr:hypothetical protein [Verrucomicrobiota bacterium]